MNRSVFLFALSLCALSATVSANTLNWFNFTQDLEGLIANRNRWRWADRASLEWTIPDNGGDGFAVLTDPVEGDELYDPFVDIRYGVDFEFTYYIGSFDFQTTTLEVQQLSLDGQYIKVLQSFTYQSSPFENIWRTASVTLEPADVPSRLGVFCHMNRQNVPGSPMYGCAIDSMKISAYDPPTTTTTTTEPTTTTTTTTTEPTTTTELTTTTEPTTTTTTTTTTEATTTEEPDTEIDYDFSNSTRGWTLGRSNGAAWRYSSTQGFPVKPFSGNNALEVFPEDIYSGTVIAMSPRLVVLPGDNIRLTVEFYMNGTREYPSYLKVRRRLSFTEYDESPAVNLDGFGDQSNQQWLSYTSDHPNVVEGEEFNIILEGGLGIANKLNKILVSRVIVEGAAEVPFVEQDFFDFTEGLVGWQAGSNDGGYWDVFQYDELDPGLGLPPPSSGNVLMVRRFDIHSGVITIESPPIPVSFDFYRINVRFWIRGSFGYPVSFRLGLKTIEGGYNYLPFLNLNEYGNADSQDWTTLDSTHPIPVDTLSDYFHIVLEADLGATEGNEIAVDNFEIFSFGPRRT